MLRLARPAVEGGAHCAGHWSAYRQATALLVAGTQRRCLQPPAKSLASVLCSPLSLTVCRVFQPVRSCAVTIILAGIKT